MKWHILKWKRPGMRKRCVVKRGFVGEFRPNSFSLTGCVWRVELEGRKLRIPVLENDEWFYMSELEGSR